MWNCFRWQGSWIIIIPIIVSIKYLVVIDRFLEDNYLKKLAITTGIISLLILLFLAYDILFDKQFEVSDEEIALDIQLNLKEDIGLLVIDYECNQSYGSGGSSNADKSLLRQDERIIYTLDKRSFDYQDDLSDTTIQFTIITEYFNPNFENIYPEEHTITIPPITFDAQFGESYSITISGDKTNGYIATLIE